MNQNIGSPYYNLCNPRLKASMKAANIYVHKAQTDHDARMRIVSNKMREFEKDDPSKVVHEVYVNREHITCVKTQNGSKEIWCENDLISMYEERSKKWIQGCKLVGWPIDVGQDDEMEPATKPDGDKSLDAKPGDDKSLQV